MRRDGIRRLEKVELTKKSVPITYMIFDLIYFEDKWLDQLALQERIKLLEKIIIPRPNIQIVTSHDDGGSLFKSVQKHGMDRGQVFKATKYLSNS